MKRLIVISILAIAGFITIPLSIAEDFIDVQVDDYHYLAIKYLKDEGVIDGHEDGSFRADENINRAEALKMLTIASGVFDEEEFQNSTEALTNPFTDVPEDAWYSKYVSAAYNKGIINGYDDGTFKPEQKVNLVEALRIYLESHDNIIYPAYEEYILDDVPEDAWFTKYVAYALQKNMLIIHPSNEIYPDQEISRGYLAELIYRKKKSGEGYGFGKATYYFGIPETDDESTQDSYDQSLMVAAHQTLAIGTIVEVTSLSNGKSVEVKVTDRGPYGPGRVLDLSEVAFAKLAPLSEGVINVQYRVVETP